MKQLKDPHITPVELLEYFESKLSEERQKTIEEHFAECDSCTHAARQTRVFEELWPWTAQEHGELYQRALLDRALECAEAETPPNLLERLRRWRREGLGRAAAGLRLVLEKSRVVASSLSRPTSPWRFELVAQAVPVRGTSSESTPSALLRTITEPGRPSARVAVQAGKSGEIVIRVDGLAAGEPSPLVLLIDTSSAPPLVRTAQVEGDASLGYRIARFEALPEGEYLLLFAPLDEPGPA
jgi:hypothetical protein